MDCPLSIVGVAGFIEEIDKGDGGKAYAFAIANVSIIKANAIGKGFLRIDFGGVILLKIALYIIS